MKKIVERYLRKKAFERVLSLLQERKGELRTSETVREFDLFNTGIRLNLVAIEEKAYDFIQKIIEKELKKGAKK